MDKKLIKPEFLHLINWPVPHIQAFTTTRNHPYLSPSCLAETNTFSYFNLGLHVGDNSEQVMSNRLALEQNILSGRKIQWLEQVHGRGVAVVSQFDEQPITADAAITSNPNIALAIMTADCLPILLSNRQGTEIAAIHAGWRPLAQNIIAHTIEKMSSKTQDVYAWLGPCISQSVFEVGAEVRQVFIDIDQDLAQYFSAKEGNKYLADLQGIASWQLTKKGVHNMSFHKECTYKHIDKYFSYRRDGVTGRMASVIALHQS